MDAVREIYGEVLPTSYFNSVPLFYSLYCVIYDLSFGLKDSKYVKKLIVASDYPKIKSALENFEANLEEMLAEKSNVPSDIRQFIEDYTRHTTNAEVRRRRHNFLLDFICRYLEEEK
jgi:hypothetical protein